MSETNTTDSNTYHEVNIDRYSELQYGGAKLFTNGNGDVVLTLEAATADQLNSGANIDYLKYYDMNSLVVEKDLEAGTQSYSVKDINIDGRGGFTDNGIRNYVQFRYLPDGQEAKLLAIENELKGALIDDYKNRIKTDPNTKPPNILNLQPTKIAPPTEIGIDLDKVQANFKKIQATDTLLQRLSLKNLKYPIDADYGNTQDYIQINQFTYQGVNPSVLFPKKEGDETTFDAAKRIAGDTLLGGLERTSPKNHHIGLVKLPMPNQLNDSNNVAWGEDQLNALTAAAATLGAGALDQGIQFTENLLNGKYEGPFDFLQQVFGSAQKDGLALVDFLKKAAKDQDANLLARSAVGSSLLNLAGFGISPETILARGAGVIPNSNLELLFNAPALRAFRFDWKMSPRSQQEAVRINNIIRFFKQGMAAKKVGNSTPGGTSYFLGTPNIFDIHFKTSKSKNEFTNTNHSVLKIKTCACVGAAVNYTPEGMWNAYEKGQPTSCILSLQFKELEPIYNTDYEEDPFAYTDLTGSLPLDAVGY